jgi:hypothetical protein
MYDKFVIIDMLYNSIRRGYYYDNNSTIDNTNLIYNDIDNIEIQIKPLILPYTSHTVNFNALYNDLIDEIIKLMCKYNNTIDSDILCGKLYYIIIYNINNICNVYKCNNLIHQDIVENSLYYLRQQYCEHKYITDDIDTTLDSSMNIKYCEYCEHQV